MNRIRCVVGLLALAVGSVAAAPVPHRPLKMGEGYQEIALAPKLFYLSISGKNKATVADLERAWAKRASELCAAAGTSHFVRLNHLFERLVASDPIASTWRPRAGPVRVGGGAYVPIYVPAPSGPSFLDAPAMNAHLRCLDQGPDVLMPERLVAVRPAAASG
jgi:hypothetical protein